MKMQSLKFFTILAVASAIVTLSAVAKSPESPQRVNDFKITERMTVGGQSFETTTMIKGARERSERHMNIAGMPAGMNMDMPMDLSGQHSEPVSSTVEFPYGFPSAGRYRIFIQMKHGSTIETGAFDASVE